MICVRALLVLALLAVPALASPASPDVVASAADYVESRVRADGSLDGAPTSQGVQALAAAGRDPHATRREGGRSPVEWLRANPPAENANAYAWEQAILGIAAAREDPASFGGVDHTARLRAHFVGGQMGSPAYVNDDVWGILALRAAGAAPGDPMVAGMRDTVLASQALDGSWSHVMFQGGDVDVTGAAVSALVEAGLPRDHDAVARGLAYLDQKRDAAKGGWSAKPGLPVNVQSTAWALNAYRAAGRALPEGALDFIARSRCADGGLATSPPATACERGNAWATVEGLVILAGSHVPVRRHLAVEAVASPPSSRAHETVRFEARAPADAGAIAHTTWRFGDGATAEGLVVEHAYEQRGRYRATVEVATRDGRLGEAGVEVHVEPAPPVATVAAAPATTHRGAPVAISALGSGDPDGRIVTYAFDFGDGNASAPGPDPVAAHAWTLPGVYVVTLTVVDEDGLSARATTQVEVVNRAPVLALVAPASVDRVAPARFQAEALDPDGDALAWTWRFGDGNVSTEPRPAHRFEALGERVVEAAACDRFGACAVATARVEVVNLPPRLAAPTRLAAVLGEPFALEARASDPDGPEPAVTWILGGRALEGARVRAAIDREGPHDVVVRARDAEGAEVEALVHVEVAPAGSEAPSADPEALVETPRAASPALVLAEPVVEGRVARLAAQVVQDDGRGRAYRFDFGDGAATGWLDAPAARHRFATPGLHVVTVEARDEDGNVLVARAVARIENRPPAIAVDRHGVHGAALAARGTATDPDGDAIRVVARVAGRALEAGGAAWSLDVAGLAVGPGVVTLVPVDAHGAAGEPVTLAFEVEPAIEASPPARESVAAESAATSPAATPGAPMVAVVAALAACARLVRRRA
ncbi:MAG TPA: PKD domain-containing protein [Candidatus Thermoplasmatota archaeon]|nr:PKD domain-containing protein [Candidatus Thermoplasmatota archaeon]